MQRLCQTFLEQSSFGATKNWLALLLERSKTLVVVVGLAKSTLLDVLVVNRSP
jgi:hypothetical protein